MRINGKVIGGRCAVDVDGMRVLAIQVLAQAVRDARCRDTRQQIEAIGWLNSPEARGIARLLGVQQWQGKQEIALQDLPTRVRDTWFVGGAP